MESPQSMRLSRYDELVGEIATDCYANLSIEEVLYLRMHPQPIEHHMKLGAVIRNTYAHRFEAEGIPYQRDPMSLDVFRALLPSVLPEYGDVPLCYSLFDYRTFCDLHVYYMLGFNPTHLDCIKKHYSKLTEAVRWFDANPYDAQTEFDEWNEYASRGDSPLIEFVEALADNLWNFPDVKYKAVNLYGLAPASIDRFETFCRNILNDGQWNGGRVVPSQLVYLRHHGAIEANDLDAALTPIIWLLENNPGNDIDLHERLFESRRTAQVLARHAGRLLARMPLFQDDYDIVMDAVSNDPDAIRFASTRLQQDQSIVTAAARNARRTLIFQNPVMSAYKDDDFLVGLACMANGANLAAASTRLRDDMTLASIAVHNITETYPYAAYQSLSRRLKGFKDIALTVVRSGHVDIEDFPAILRDDDDIAAAIAASGHNRWQLERMSSRIRAKYGIGTADGTPEATAPERDR